MNSCSEQGCQQSGIFICTCSQAKQLFCEDHIEDHIAQNKNCLALKNFIKNASLKPRVLQEKCKDTINLITACKQRLIGKSKEVISNITTTTFEGINELRGYENLIQNFKTEIEENAANELGSN
jgi:hypothetical protein